MMTRVSVPSTCRTRRTCRTCRTCRTRLERELPSNRKESARLGGDSKRIDELEMRGDLAPARDGEVVKPFEAVFIAQLQNRGQRLAELVRDAPIEIADAEVVLDPIGYGTRAADANVTKHVN